MLCADESLGRCSSTLSDNFATERSLPSAINGCSRSAAVNFCVATTSFSSLAAIVGMRGRVVFTVARCAQPQHPKIDNVNTMFLHDFIVRSAIRFERARARYIGKQIR